VSLDPHTQATNYAAAVRTKADLPFGTTEPADRVGQGEVLYPARMPN